MTTLIVTVPSQSSEAERVTSNERMQIVVNVHAEILDSEVTLRRAIEWLHENVDDLLGASTPELMLGEQLLWRYDVVLGLPNEAQPGSGSFYRIGQILLDAVTGEIQNSTALAQELKAHISSLVH